MYNVAIVGAGGLVGRQLVQELDACAFPCAALRLFASERSVGDFIDSGDDAVALELLEPGCLTGMDIAFFTAPAQLCRRYVEEAAAAGTVCIDMSGAWLGADGVPVVVPEVNGAAVADARNKKIIANPPSIAIALALVVAALAQQRRIKRLLVSTYQAVSACGQKGVDELRRHSGALLNGKPVRNKVFAEQIGFNCLPCIDAVDNSADSGAETAICTAMAGIFAATAPAISVTAVHVPVFYGDGAAVNIEFESALAVDEVRRILADAPAVNVAQGDGADYVTTAQVCAEDGVCVGRIRADASCPAAVNMWLAIDNVRKGSAQNAVQIAELAVRHIIRCDS